MLATTFYNDDFPRRLGCKESMQNRNLNGLDRITVIFETNRRVPTGGDFA